MIPEAAVWAIFFLPLGAFIVIGFVIRPFLNHHRFLSSAVLIAALVASLALAFWTLGSVVDQHGDLGVPTPPLALGGGHRHSYGSDC